MEPSHLSAAPASSGLADAKPETLQYESSNDYARADTRTCFRSITVKEGSMQDEPGTRAVGVRHPVRAARTIPTCGRGPRLERATHRIHPHIAAARPLSGCARNAPPNRRLKATTAPTAAPVSLVVVGSCRGARA